MFFAKIPRHTRQNAITEGDLECILTRNCEGTEQLRQYEFLMGELEYERKKEQFFRLYRFRPGCCRKCCRRRKHLEISISLC